jgi:hypothetical protein
MLRKLTFIAAIAGALAVPTASFAHGWGGHHGGHGWGGHHGGWGWGGGRYWGGQWYPYGSSCWRPTYGGGWVWVCD